MTAKPKARRKQPKRQHRDAALAVVTPERRQHDDVRSVQVGVGIGCRAPRVETQRLIDRALKRGAIDRRQHDAADHLHKTWLAMNGEPSLVADYGVVRGGDGDPTGERQAAATQRYRAALEAMGGLRNIVVAVVIYENAASDWATEAKMRRADGPKLLRDGLDALANHWRL